MKYIVSVLLIIVSLCAMKETRKSIFLGELISTIDDAVEKVEDYDKRVATEYPYLTDPQNPEKVRPVEIIIL